MTDTKALRERIEQAGLKLGFIANQLGLSSYGLQRKINNLSEFRVSEVVKLCEMLRIDSRDKERIFFARKVD